MSSFGKILAEITVPTGGWTLSFNHLGVKTATIPAGTYTSVLTLIAALASAIDTAIAGTSTCTVSGAGIVSISTPSLSLIYWSACTAGLRTFLGIVGTLNESAVDNAVTHTHTHGWYPGVITYGTSDGVGLAADTGWMADDVASRTIAGSGSARIISPARLSYTRVLTFDGLHRDEALADRERGAMAVSDRWISSKLTWYPDRDLGTVASTGTQGDPGHPYYDDDADCDYWVVTTKRTPKVSGSGSQNPDYMRVDVEINGEPK